MTAAQPPDRDNPRWVIHPSRLWCRPLQGLPVREPPAPRVRPFSMVVPWANLRHPCRMRPVLAGLRPAFNQSMVHGWGGAARFRARRIKPRPHIRRAGSNPVQTRAGTNHGLTWDGRIKSRPNMGRAGSSHIQAWRPADQATSRPGADESTHLNPKPNDPFNRPFQIKKGVPVVRGWVVPADRNPMRRGVCVGRFRQSWLCLPKFTRST
ncbi:hypothetical protein APED_09600 [Acanthopleuribacter pedis]